MKLTKWEEFFHKAVIACLPPGAQVLDVGAGLRIDASRGNVVDEKRLWIKPLVEQATYQVMDPVDTYHPDVIGDVMAMPFADETWDSLFCLAVLEHVPRPWDAMKEIYRVLKPGGRALLYVPFLSPYHAMPGYYGDFFRFTEDGIRSLCAPFTSVELVAVRGPIETLTHLLPGHFFDRLLRGLARFVDGLRRASGKQVSGYYFLVKK